MVAAGVNAQIIRDNCRTLQVSSFKTDYESLNQDPMVDTNALIVRDVISVTAMDQKFILPFSMRDAGINVRTTQEF